MDKQQFGSLIRQHRSEARLTQRQLAAQCDCEPAHIWQIETGTQLPSPETTIHLAEALHLDATAIVCNWLRAKYASTAIADQVHAIVASANEQAFASQTGDGRC